jgi:RNA polymerase sigma factor (sigma-70 family)
VSGPGERELDALMGRLADGDRAAFDPLFAALHPRAVAAARLRLEGSDADDAAQQALLRVFARASEFTPGRPALPWFYAIVANEVHTLARRCARRRGRELPGEASERVAAADDPERELLGAEICASLRAAIASLDVPSAEAIRSLLGEAPRPEVEAPAFRKRVSRAYARLRVLLGGRS